MSNNLSPDLIQFVRCPVTKFDLVPADQAMLDNVNDEIKHGNLVNQVGQTIESPIENGLVNADGSLLLPVRGGIVILISDQAIPLDQLKK